ncbi:MAG: phage baseplate assembly protein V [Nostocaceae cyanobacterium]|nr:phage baseplate assembly protein V [Nostocaceae cyanobacterium]
MKEFWGKYRGKVTSSKDPLNLGRVQVEVPAVLGPGRHSWALPCTPYAGNDIGWFTVPPVGTNIWVEFEGGDPDYPIWSGCFWNENELPQNARVDEPDKVQVFKTNGVTITISNLGSNKGLTIEVDTPVVERKLKMVFNANGIEINNKDETIARLTADIIQLDNQKKSTITVAKDNIQLKESSVEIKLTANTIDLIDNPSTIKLTTSAIELANNPAKVKIAPPAIELSDPPATTKLAPSGIEISMGAANIKLSPISVNVNNGALEVI